MLGRNEKGLFGQFIVPVQREGQLRVGFKSIAENAILLNEVSTTGMSLTNCIEAAIEKVVQKLGEEVEIYQDCGDEGIFRVHYKSSHQGGLQPAAFGYGSYTITDVAWEFFSKDLSTFEVLYGKN